jgi:hypothetical protein
VRPHHSAAQSICVLVNDGGSGHILDACPHRIHTRSFDDLTRQEHHKNMGSACSVVMVIVMVMMVMVMVMMMMMAIVMVMVLMMVKAKVMVKVS